MPEGTGYTDVELCTYGGDISKPCSFISILLITQQTLQSESSSEGDQLFKRSGWKIIVRKRKKTGEGIKLSGRIKKAKAVEMFPPVQLCLFCESPKNCKNKKWNQWKKQLQYS